jgi:hypothetical protein
VRVSYAGPNVTLLDLLPIRERLVVPWIFFLGLVHVLIRVWLAHRDRRPLPPTLRVIHEPHWFAASLLVLAGAMYRPIISAFAEVPAYLIIAGAAGLFETIRGLRS